MIQLKLSYLLSICFLFSTFCGFDKSTNIKNENISERVGRLAFDFHDFEGGFKVKSTIFVDLDKCIYHIPNCKNYPEIALLGYSDSTDKPASISLPLKDYFAITEIEYASVDFWNCESFEFTIYHGFNVSGPRYRETYELYNQENCLQMNENEYVCPPIKLIEASTFLIDIHKNKPEIGWTVRHLKAPASFVPFIIFQCGLVARNLSNFEIKISNQK